MQYLGAVMVRGRVKSNKEKLDEQYSSGLFGGGNATIFDLVSDGSAIRVTEYIRLSAKQSGRAADYYRGPTPSLSWRGRTPAVYLNEMKVDAGTVSNISVSDIAMVKVFSPGESGVIGGGSGGVIAVYTKKGA